MKLEDIIKSWEEDSKVPVDQLQEQAANVAYLHNKYYKIFLQERVTLRSLESARKKMYLDKFEYFTGTIDEARLKERQWKPFALRVLKTEVPMHMEADQDMIALDERIGVQKDKVEFLESIIKQINNRNFQIKNIIEFLRWSQGSL